MITIRKAVQTDAETLSRLERESGEAFRSIAGLEWIADDPPIPPHSYRELINEGIVLVASEAGRQLGFVAGYYSLQVVHIQQLSVSRAEQKRGIGRSLMREIEVEAHRRGAAALTLTTFRDLPFNEGLYASLGFDRIDTDDLSPHLQQTMAAEEAIGLPVHHRCAMKKSLTPVQNS